MSRVLENQRAETEWMGSVLVLACFDRLERDGSRRAQSDHRDLFRQLME